ncbi:hypothetical protein KBC99_00985 [Candidatus Saccharibacteria bacterium]|nr:hypothetical protein [Candidatus Saccharibacteria bacterium]
MNRSLKIGLIIVGIVVTLGIVGAVVLRKQSSSVKTSDQSASLENGQGDMSFAALSTQDSNFTATITTDADGKKSTAKMEYDKTNDALRYSMDSNGNTMTMIYTKDAYYMCSSSTQCIKYSLENSQNTGGFDRKSYEYTAEELANLKKQANYIGRKACESGTCDAWKISVDGSNTTMYIDTNTKRISQIENITASGSSKIVYSYTSSTVTPPPNAKSLQDMMPAGE